MDRFLRKQLDRLHELYEPNYQFGNFPSFDEIVESEILSNMDLWEFQRLLLCFVDEVLHRCPSPGSEMQGYEWGVRLHQKSCEYCLDHIEQFGLDQ